MTTPLDIIRLALKDAGVIGVGQTPLAEDINDSFDRLNWMVSTWARKRWLVHHLVDIAKVSTGAQSYSVGPGGDFEIAVRPDKIEASFLRQNAAAAPTVAVPQSVAVGLSPFVYVAGEAGTLTVQGGTVSALLYSNVTADPAWVAASSPISMQAGDGVQIRYTVAPTVTFTPAQVQPAFPPTVPTTAIDYPITILRSREDYNRIAMKGMTPNLTYYLFYDTAWPLGYLWPFPAPRAGMYELHIAVKMVMPEFTSLDQDLNLPPEYKAALHFNLADRLRVAYNIPIPPNDKLAGWAKDALAALRGANAQISKMKMPGQIRTRRGTYNIFSDQS